MITSYDSPTDLRKKLKRAYDSRDEWRAKHRESQYELKKIKAMLNSARTNRDKWRAKCDEFQTETLAPAQESCNEAPVNLVQPTFEESVPSCPMEKKLPV